MKNTKDNYINDISVDMIYALKLDCKITRATIIDGDEIESEIDNTDNLELGEFKKLVIKKAKESFYEECEDIHYGDHDFICNSIEKTILYIAENNKVECEIVFEEENLLIEWEYEEDEPYSIDDYHRSVI